MNRTLEIVLAVVVVGTALAFGGVVPAAYSAMEIVVFASLLALLIHETWQGRIELHVAMPPMLFALWLGLELVPLPPGLIRLLEPARFQGPNPLHVSGTAWVTLSIYPHATILTGIRFLAYLAAFVLAVHVFDSRRRSSLLVRSLIGLGLFEAVYGSVEYLTGWEKIFTYSKQAYTGMATGTYINHNHFAGALEMTLPLVVGYVFYYFQIWQEGRGRRSFRSGQSGSSAGFAAVACVFLVIVMLVGLLFSRSRSGILGALISLLFIALLAQLRVRRKTWLLGLFIFLAVAVGYGLWIGLGPMLARFETLGLGQKEFDVATRLSFYKDALGIIRDYPWAGTGLGTFAVAFRHYQSDWVIYFVEHVHNDYVEFAAETGLLGASLLFAPILYLLVRMVIAFVTDSRRYRPSVLLGCIGSVFAILLHSATDFNLQIPANALVLAVVLGIGYKAACVERRTEDAETTPARPRHRAHATVGRH
ncbi:MAG TPA: O-antigen ligase family protein [Terriglobia bacterium]|nr:O-antigen ligase family protein [Terriglobia bacterium]